jgi:hypothetical protein
VGELLRQLPLGMGGLDRQDPSEDPQCTFVVGKRATISPAGLRPGTLGTKVISIANANRPEVAVILNVSRSKVYGR